jgi:hypothetical protein
MRKKVAFFWHSLRYSFNSIILEDCLCDEMKTKIKAKRDYHSTKVKELVSSTRVGEY